jgi:Icc-related predicted phosphoesterase
MVFGKKKGSSSGKSTTIFYATDLHGSTICFKKFLNAPAYYKSKGKPVHALIMGGDVAGKLIVPILHEGGHFKAHLTGMDYDMTAEDELVAFRKSCDTLGIYPYIFEPDEYAAFAGDKERQDKLFKQLVLERLREWVELADERLKDQTFTCYMSPGNDDFQEIDDVLGSGDRIVVPNNQRLLIDDEHEMISSGYANITPFHCPRDLPEEDLLERLETLAGQVENMSRCVFNIHVPPRDTGIDDAPHLDADLRPQIGPQGVVMAAAGSSAVRTLITKYQPLLALHGHIHESKGVAKIGRTLCLNPGSEYSEGILRGLLVTIDGDRVESHMMTSG